MFVAQQARVTDDPRADHPPSGFEGGPLDQQLQGQAQLALDHE